MVEPLELRAVGRDHGRADRHPLVDGGFLRVTDPVERHACRSSAPCAVQLVAREYGPAVDSPSADWDGEDAARGLLAVAAAGWSDDSGG